MATAVKRQPLTVGQRKTVDRAMALLQSGDVLEVDRDMLLQEGMEGAFMCYYFPRSFFYKGQPRWERLNREVISFLERNNEGMMWLPATHGKTTTILRYKILILCREPQISMIYIEKNEPTSLERSRAVMNELDNNTRLINHFGAFRGEQWSAKAWTIRQRPFTADTPTCAYYGSGGGSALGKRCNILFVDDPVTVDNSTSERERDSMWQWYTEAASTSPSPLPLTKWMKYLRRNYLDGTTFHSDDLYHRVLKNDPDIPFLHLLAVNNDGSTLSPRFVYVDPDELARKIAEGDEAAIQTDKDLRDRFIENLYLFKKKKGTVAFNRRYQNKIISEESKFQEVWFRGGHDDYCPPEGYPGCLDSRLTLGAHFPNFRYVTGVDPASGSHTKESARFACVTLGADPKNPLDIYLTDIDYGQFPAQSDNRQRRTQLGIILDHVARYDSRIALETNNVQQIYAGMIRAEAQRKHMVVSIVGHWTTRGAKLDPDLGIEAIVPVVENGKLHLPYAEPHDKKLIDELIEEFVYWGVHPTQDIVMAFWFAWRVLQRQLRMAKAQTFTPAPIPPWRNRGHELHFPDQWTEQQIQDYLHGKPAEEEEEVEL